MRFSNILKAQYHVVARAVFLQYNILSVKKGSIMLHHSIAYRIARGVVVRKALTPQAGCQGNQNRFCCAVLFMCEAKVLFVAYCCMCHSSASLTKTILWPKCLCTKD